jgi:hypothetical protein
LVAGDSPKIAWHSTGGIPHLGLKVESFGKLQRLSESRTAHSSIEANNSSSG